MDEVFVIGLPRALRRPMEARATRAGGHLSAVLAEIGRRGTPDLLPLPRDAIHSLNAYLQRTTAPQVLVLPYAPVPKDVQDAIASLPSGTAAVISAEDERWPRLRRDRNFDGEFLDALAIALGAALFGEEETSLTEYVQRLATRCPRLLISLGALDRCDEVAEHRRAFVRKASDALHYLCEQHGSVGSLSKFFDDRGLEFAHSGGAKTKIDVFLRGKNIHVGKSHDHLKQGDNTTLQSAARFYFQAFAAEGVYYVVILYVGPHIDTDFNRVIYL